ncbi:MAG TPA: transposase [Polyangia bacterium]
MPSTQPAASCHTHAPAGAGAYERHCPETTLLYRTIQEHWSSFLADLEVGGGELPAFVLDEFEAYLRCGILVHGFLRVRCKDCGHCRVVGFSCKRRGFCPSCLGRRMADTAAFCVDHLFPKVPARQYVLSLPYALRFKLAYSPDATSMVLSAFISAINSDLRRRARKRKLRGRLQSGSLTVVQRFGSSLNLNVHFHVIGLDGAYAEQPDGSLLFHPLPAPSDEDIARLARAVCRKVTRYLGRLTGEEKDQQLTLDHFANASVQGLVATGPRRGCRVLRLGGTGEYAEAAIIGKRCAEVAGFNVNANVRVGAKDRVGLEHLCRYLARPPIANDRLQELPDGRLALRFKQAWRDGTSHVAFTPNELIEKLIPLIPRPRAHLVRYHGILGPAAKDREKVVPTPSALPAPDKVRAEAAGDDKVGTGESRAIDISKIARGSRLPWALLLKRVFMTDALTCPKCQGRMKILAAITKPEAIRKILEHLGIPSEAPPRTAARPPPQAELSGTADLAEVDYADPSSPEW